MIFEVPAGNFCGNPSERGVLKVLEMLDGAKDFHLLEAITQSVRVGAVGRRQLEPLSSFSLSEICNNCRCLRLCLLLQAISWCVLRFVSLTVINAGGRTITELVCRFILTSSGGQDFMAQCER